MLCSVCDVPISSTNAIVSRKGQTDTINYYHLHKYAKDSNLVRRTDIALSFSLDGEKVGMCKKCFSVAVKELINEDWV